MGGRAKVVERQRARELRAAGWTLQAIASAVGASKGTVSVWVRDVALEGPLVRSRAAPRHRAPNVLERRKRAEIESMIASGRDRIGSLSDRDLLIAGTALYAGEGSKTDATVRFSNTNPRMVDLFCRWLRRFFVVDESRMRVALYLHQGLDLEAATAHWAAVTRVPPSQFTSPFRATPDPSIRRSKHHLGCATVSYSCARTHRAVMGLVHGLLSSEVIPG